MPGSIKDWPEEDRPREKLLRRGPGELTDAELLAVVLRSGRPGESALDQGRAVVAAFGTFRRLAEATVNDLCGIKGLGPAKSAQILAALEIAKRYGEHEFRPGEIFGGPADIFAHFRERLAGERREHFFAVLLDNKHRKIRDVRVSQGSLTSSIVHPRDVFEPVVRESAAAVVFVHNHPSGDPTPSREDIEITRRLRQVGEVMGVRVLDHIVIGHGRYVSFVNDGYW
ncbi:MAG TPA: DNA repair protein RadC [Candidatus Acidoferrales bacterium]|nr:DNA repair protein RadC [Candidatus Acidoferrales bacterium]